jgi:hypothetical protein
MYGRLAGWMCGQWTVGWKSEALSTIRQVTKAASLDLQPTPWKTHPVPTRQPNHFPVSQLIVPPPDQQKFPSKN